MSEPIRTPTARKPLDSGSRALSIVAQRIDGQWALLLWWDASLPHKVLGLHGRERRWSRLSSALEFAARRYPSVSSFQLFWPPRWVPGKVRSTATRMGPSSSIMGLPSLRL